MWFDVFLAGRSREERDLLDSNLTRQPIMAIINGTSNLNVTSRDVHKEKTDVFGKFWKGVDRIGGKWVGRTLLDYLFEDENLTASKRQLINSTVEASIRDMVVQFNELVKCDRRLVGFRNELYAIFEVLMPGSTRAPGAG